MNIASFTFLSVFFFKLSVGTDFYLIEFQHSVDTLNAVENCSKHTSTWMLAMILVVHVSICVPTRATLSALICS